MDNKIKKRRQHGSGTIYERKDGRWCAQIIIGKRENGYPDRKTLYASTKKDAELKLQQELLLLQKNNGIRVNKQDDIVLNTAYMSWLLVYKKPTITGATLESYLAREKNIFQNWAISQFSK